MAHPDGGEVLFDAPLEVNESLDQLWDEAIPISLQDVMRLHYNGLLIRRHVSGDYRTDYGKELVSMKTRLAVAETHFATLQEFGLCIVRHVTQLIPEQREDGFRPPSTANTTVAYSASSYVNHAVGLDNKTASAEISARKIKEMVIDPLQNYYEWCKETGASLMLADIYDPHQFSWHMTSKVVFLHDIDPRLTDKAPGSASSNMEPLVEPYEIDDNFEDIGY